MSSKAYDREKQRSRSRSRQKPANHQRQQAYLRKGNIHDRNEIPSRGNKAANGESIDHNQQEQETQKKQIKKELLRSFLRISQFRQQPIDKFVKIVWIYKGKFVYDHKVHEIMNDPRKYLQKMSANDLTKLIELSQGHRLYEHYQKSSYQPYWTNLITLARHILQKAASEEQKLQSTYELLIKQVIAKPLPELTKLEKKAEIVIKQGTFGAAEDYWKQVLIRIKVKKSQLILNKFYQQFRQNNEDKLGMNDEFQQEDDMNNQDREPTSPTLVPFSSVNPKLLVNQDQQMEEKKKLSIKIYEQQFEKNKQKLLINLSLPANHNLLTTQIITEQSTTYDQITKEIIEFQKYKRLQEDEQQFNDWVPCQTEGRFRDQKPVYINRVRVAYEWNKYNSAHYNETNPPPKTIQGYKFNIFYPDLYDKQKTPQYYLQNTDDPNYCIIKFKAGPPYKDIAFKILKKQWDITEKSGFESIFGRGILHLYFNFKKPKFRI